MKKSKEMVISKEMKECDSIVKSLMDLVPDKKEFIADKIGRLMTLVGQITLATALEQRSNQVVTMKDLEGEE